MTELRLASGGGGCPGNLPSPGVRGAVKRKLTRRGPVLAGMDALLPWGVPARGSRRSGPCRGEGRSVWQGGRAAVRQAGRCGLAKAMARPRSGLSRRPAAPGSPVRRPVRHSIGTGLLKPGMTGCSVFSCLRPRLPVISVFARLQSTDWRMHHTEHRCRDQGGAKG